MPAEKIAHCGAEPTIDRAEFIRDPGKAFRMAGESERVVIVSTDGKRRAFLTVPRTELVLDSE